MVKNPNWPEANLLAIYKRGRGFELGTNPRSLQENSQSERAYYRSHIINIHYTCY